jgi:hypothetical protein
MEQTKVACLPGSPVPSDPSEPHLPSVDVLCDMDGLFAEARQKAVAGDVWDGRQMRQMIVVTPRRTLTCVPVGPPSRDALEQARRVFGSDQPLRISVVSFTKFDSTMEAPPQRIGAMNKSIPFFGFLLGFAEVGHAVVVFEGHPSAFEAGVRDSEVLIVDSAMLPFLQQDWASVAFGAMRRGAEILIHDRERYEFRRVVKAAGEPGWEYGEPDGEASYANCLLTAMAKGSGEAVRIVAGSPLPNLAQIDTAPDDAEWISSLPFKYDQLRADLVITILIDNSKLGLLGFFKRSWFLRVTLITTGGKRTPVCFRMTRSREAGRRQLDVQLY